MIKRDEIIPAIIGLSIAALLCGVVYAWKYPAPIDYFQRAAYPTKVKSGDIVTISWTEMRSHSCDSIIWKKLIGIDGSIRLFEPVRVEPKPTNTQITEEYQFRVPSGFQSGPLIYRVTAEFRCNIVQRLMGGHIFVLPDIVFDYTNTGDES